MFADPQSVTVNAVAKSLARISITPTQTTYTTADGEFTLTVRQTSTAGRFRREIRLAQKKVAADPISAVNKEVGLSFYMVIDEPKWGFTDTEIGYVIAGLKTWLDATAYGKVLAGES